jgi:gas vesicle protein
MRDQDEGAYVLIERDRGGSLGAFVVGALIGAGVALLFAPKTGEETQEDLRQKARELRDAAEDRVRDAQRRFGESVETARDGVESQLETVRGAVDQGRVAAQEAREDIERRLAASKAAYRAGVEAGRDPEGNEEVAAAAGGTEEHAED